MRSLKSWGGVTDPTVHNPDKFRYLVHMDTGYMPPGTTRPKYFIDDPEQIKIAPRLSASLIDQNRRIFFPFSKHGFILEVPPTRIVGTSAYDWMSSHCSLEQVRKSLPVRSPDELLRDNRAYGSCTEVVIRDGAKAVGMILVERELESLWYQYEPAEIRETAERLGLPLVTVVPL